MNDSNFAYSPVAVERLVPLYDNIIVHNMMFDERFTTGGIVLLDDDGKSSGIRPRWAQVYSVGPDQKDVLVGQWVLVEHGRWTRGIKIKDENGEHVVRKVDPDCIILVSDNKMSDETLSDKIS